MIHHSIFASYLFLFVCTPALLNSEIVGQESGKPKAKKENRFEKAIQAFEKKDKANPPKKDTVLFLGSSSIRMWKLEKWFPKKGYLNRGFGGSEISDSIHFFDRVVVPYEPKLIVFYAGDNDVAKGKSPQTVLDDFKSFASLVDKALPKTKIVFVAIKPSISRWKLVKPMRKANEMIKSFAKSEAKIAFADIDSPMIGTDGKPKENLFLDDGLHLNEEGYKVWYDVIQPLIK